MRALTVSPAGRVTRLRAALLDLGAIVTWLIAMAAVAAALWAAGLEWPRTVFTASSTADLAQFVVVILPAGVYLAAGEAGEKQATSGKRRARLVVARLDAGRPTIGQIALRTIVKLLPWQLGHVAVTRAVGNVEGSGASTISLLAFGGAYGLVALNLVLFLARADRRVVHDLVAGTQVVAAEIKLGRGTAA